MTEEFKRLEYCPNTKCRSNAITYKPLEFFGGGEQKPEVFGICQRCGVEWPEKSLALDTYFKEPNQQKIQVFDNKIIMPTSTHVKNFGGKY